MGVVNNKTKKLCLLTQFSVKVLKSTTILQALATLVKALLITVIWDWTFHLEIELLIQDLFCFEFRGLLRILTHFGRFLFVKSDFKFKKNSRTDNWNWIINFRSLCMPSEDWKILPWVQSKFSLITFLVLGHRIPPL